MNCVIRLRRCVRKEGQGIGEKGIYRYLSCLVNTYTGQNRLRVVVLAELSRIRLELGRIRLELGRIRLELGRIRLELGRIRLELGRIRLELGRIWQTQQSLVEYSGIQQKTANCYRLRQFYSQSLVIKLVETGRRV